MHEKAYNVDCLRECIALTKLPIREELIDLVARDPSQPRLPFFDVGLEENTRPMAGQDSVSHAEATISDDDLALPMDGLCHHHHRLCSCTSHFVVLHRDGPRPTVSLLDQLDPPKDL